MTRKEVTYNEEDEAFSFECPHCNIIIQVLKSETACCIFRHAVYKNTYQQIGPHTRKDECDRLVLNNEVIGCAKPFKFYKSTNPYVEDCGYI
jgi:hypothetical protein